ncbi:MAG: hypothetical protein Kow0092_20550 [Deferrisomatales bacterium]
MVLAGVAAAWGVLGVWAPEGAAAVAETAVVRNLTLLPEAGGTRIRLEISGPTPYELSVSDAPPAVELHLPRASIEGIPPHVDVGDGTVTAVDVTPVSPEGARVAVGLTGRGDARVDPWQGGLDLIVRVAGAAEPSADAGSSGAAVRLLAGGRGVEFAVGGEPDNLSAFLLSDGRRLVVDADGVTIAQPQLIQEFPEGPLARARLGRQDDRVRTVVEAREPGTFDGYRVEKRPYGFAVLLSASPSPATASAAPGESAPPPPAGEPPSGGGVVTDLGFRQDPEWSYVEVALSRPAAHELRETSGSRVVLDLLRTAVPERFRRALDTSAFPGSVDLVAAYPRGPDTRLVVELRRPAPFRVDRDGNRVVVAVQGGSAGVAPAPVSRVEAGEEEVVVVEGGGAAEGAPRPGKAAEPARRGPRQPVYTGRKLSMDFVNADIRNVLRLIGEVSGLNLVAGDDVQGKVTVRLVDVPWDQALDVILKTRGLDQVRDGNVVRIAPAEKLAKERARALEAEKAEVSLAPLVTDIIPVSYASAAELRDKISAILSERGSVSVDERTNAVLVKDVAEKVAEAKALVRHLDTQTPQVLIEARIVEVSSTYSRDLGIQWGGRFTADTAHGNATDWAFPHSINVAGSTGADNFAVNFPAAVGAGSPGGALEMTLGHINDVLTLDLRLSAIETSGRGRVVSSPRVTTLDNRTAEILQGVQIPFTTATEEKIETQSIDYLLKLNVTPHVTADRSIIMKIELSKDAPSTTFVAVDSSTPAVETRAATTEVLVRDGETTVIGGIITDTQSDLGSEVPWLGDLPGIGWLFKKKEKRVDKTELIIFITPKIVNRDFAAREL